MSNLLRDFKRDGIYIGVARAILPCLAKLSLISLIKRLAKCCGIIDESGEKGQAWVTNACRLVLLVIIVECFLEVEQGRGVPEELIAVFITYRFVDICVFVLEWIFVADSPLHSIRRSIAGFFVNIVELSIIFTIMGKLICCQQGDGLQMLYRHFQGIATFNPPLDCTRIPCLAVSTAELVASLLLILVALASVVGAITRDEVVSAKKRRIGRRRQNVGERGAGGRKLKPSPRPSGGRQ